MSKHSRAANAAFSDLEAIKARLEEAQNALQDSINAKSERWQESEAGERAQEQLNNLETAISDIESAMGCLDDIGGSDE